jgi:hypothetical protein
MYEESYILQLNIMKPVQSKPGNIVKGKGKDKIIPVLNYAPRREGVLGERTYSSTYSLTSSLNGGEWSTSRFGLFTTEERSPVSH